MVQCCAHGYWVSAILQSGQPQTEYRYPYMVWNVGVQDTIIPVQPEKNMRACDMAFGIGILKIG